ncbi:MAG: YaeQ family protein [Thermoanaerobaculia bacterium]
MTSFPTRDTLSRVALSATIYNIAIDLSDVDRHVYETLELKLAQHPSEAIEYMVARLLAYCLEYTEGIELTQGVSAGDDPAVLVRDLTGRVTAWIEVGAPDADRLHRASKAAARVAVYTHRDPRLMTAQLEGKKIHRREELEVIVLDRALVGKITERLDRRSSLSISVHDRHLYVTIGDDTFDAELLRIP